MGASAAVGAVRAGEDPDPRTEYDVSAYRLDLWIDPERTMVQGVVAIEGTVLVDSLTTVVVDADRLLQISAAASVSSSLEDRYLENASALQFRRIDHRVEIDLEAPVAKDGQFVVALSYRGRPMVKDEFTGFHFTRTPSGQPWVASSCQTIGAHTWFPCKSSFFHPEDKPARVYLNLTVPPDLVGAANGRLVEILEEGGRKTFRWRHEYPLPTYAIAVAVAPYVLLEDELELPGCEGRVPARYYVLPEDVEKARVEFEVLPELLRFYGEVFGPFPFPGSKVGLAQTPFWGMEHSTLIAYGNSFPTWLQAHAEADVFAERNKRFDYILVHEFAHEWWGNAITARDWGDFWLHEGFATYAEALWVEHRFGLEEYLTFIQESKRGISSTESVYRPRHADAAEAYGEVIYDKGAWVLHMLRYEMRHPERADPKDQDREFFAAVLEFASDPKFRFGNARTRDFQRICERHHGARLGDFFQPWLYGTGWPHYTVERKPVEETGVTVVVTARGSSLFPFNMPLDIELVTADGEVHRRRVRLGEGENVLKLQAPGPIRDVRFPGFRWILCDLSYVP